MKENGSQDQLVETVGASLAPTVYPEHRAHHRHPFSALAEVIEPHTRTRMTCRATDLSFGGIYVDTISPFAVGTTVLVRLTCEGRSLQASARVTYALNGMGMGLAFSAEMPSQQAVALNAWIAELSGELKDGPSMDFDTAPASAQHSAHSAASDEQEKLRDATRSLVELLFQKQVLTHTEVSALRSKLAR